MNFKKTLGLVLTAAVISTSLMATKPAKAATGAVTASNAITIATATTSSKLTDFNYFFAERSLLVAGEQDTYVVDTNYNGSVQYELWVKKVSDPNAKWQVISADANGNPGYTEAQTGYASPYSIKLVSNFKFDQGEYVTAVYAKVAGTVGNNTKGHFIDANGIDTDAKNGTEQKFDIVKTGRFNAVNAKSTSSYNEMTGDFMFAPDSLVAGQKVTFKGFAGQKPGAKYKLVVRKFGDDASKQVVLNNQYASTVDWTPAEVGTYQVIAWSAPDVNKGAARDGWRITTVTVKPAVTVASVAPIALTANQNDSTFALPKTVKATLNNGTTVDAKVAWDTTVDTSKAATVTITGKLTDYNNYSVTGTVTVAPALKYVDGSLGAVNPIFGTADLKVNDSSLVTKVIVDGAEAKFTAPDATTVRIKGLSDDPKSVVLVDKYGNQVTVKEAAKVTLTYVDGSLGSVNPIFGTVDLKVNDSSLVAKVIVDGAEAKFSAPDATTVRIKGLSDDPKTLVLVDKDGNQVTVKAAAPVQTSALKYVDGSLEAVNPIFGTTNLKVNDSSLVTKVIVDGAEAKFTTPDATTVRIKGLSDDPKTLVLVDNAGIQVTIK